MSLALIPTLDAGVSSIGDITVNLFSLTPMTMPSPPNVPLVSTKNSSISSGKINEEYSSTSARIAFATIYLSNSISCELTFCSSITLTIVFKFLVIPFSLLLFFRDRVLVEPLSIILTFITPLVDLDS